MQNLHSLLAVLGIIWLPAAESSFGALPSVQVAPLRCDDNVFAFLKSKKEDEDVAPETILTLFEYAYGDNLLMERNLASPNYRMQLVRGNWVIYVLI